MSGTTVPARDSSQADLIGPGDSVVPDEPRSEANVGAHKVKSEASVAVLNQPLQGLDDPVDSIGDLVAALFQGRDAAPCGLEAGFEIVTLALERLVALLEIPRARSGRWRRMLLPGRDPLRFFLCPLSHAMSRT
jgi:hypothetical protein